MKVHLIRDLKGDGTGYRYVNLTPLKAIKYFCLECGVGDKKMIAECTDEHCPLYPFRPYQKRKEKKNEVSEVRTDVLFQESVGV